jgi:hypothetical protein
VIAFGAAMTDPEAFRRYARPGIARASEPDSESYAVAAVGTICRGNNLVLDRAARAEGLEALVLLHQDVEIVDPEFCAKLRRAFADPQVAVIGVAGATGVRSIAWWEGETSNGSVVQRYQEHGGGEQPAFCFKEHRPAPAEVETVDGFLMALSPWAVQNVRFDESLSLGFGYDLDFCLRVREAGRRVLTEDLHVVHHHAELELVDDRDLWMVGHAQAAEKLESRLLGRAPTPDEWKQRARRAEADRDGARTVAYSTAHRADAALAPLERELEAMEQSLSWRITQPLRKLNAWRRQAGGRESV